MGDYAFLLTVYAVCVSSDAQAVARTVLYAYAAVILILPATLFRVRPCPPVHIPFPPNTWSLPIPYAHAATPSLED
jgi:hypothetical protein